MATAAYDKVLVTGGTGFLGRAVSEALPGARLLGRHDVDLTDGRAVQAYVASMRPEVVIHMAARVGGIRANLEQPADFLLDNLRMDAHVCHAVKTVKPRHFIALLSTCMYPDSVQAQLYPMDESLLEAGPPPPSNAAYAAAKRALYHAVCALHGQYSVPYTCLVPANLYGPADHFGSHSSHFLAAAIAKVEQARLQKASHVQFFGTGVALRQYVYAPDLAWLIRFWVERGPSQQTLNVAPLHHATIAELARATAQAAGYAGEVIFTGTGPDGQLRKDVSTARLRQWVPEYTQMETTLAQGLVNTVAWYRKSLAVNL